MCHGPDCGPVITKIWSKYEMQITRNLSLFYLDQRVSLDGDPVL